jgi:hypothetical protein
MIKNLISKKSLAHTIKRAKFELNISVPLRPIMWYPHCGTDLDFLSSIIINNYTIKSPNLFILNDNNNIINRIEEQVQLKGFDVLEKANLSFKDDEFEGVFYKIKTNNKVVDLIVLGNCSSEKLLKYFIDNELTVENVFTCRMSGGVVVSYNNQELGLASEFVRQKLNYNYLISDLHHVGNENIDGESDINELHDYAGRLGFDILESAYYSSNGMGNNPAKFLILTTRQNR